jgi:oligosaccharyltransferase complex subunit gamma
MQDQQVTAIVSAGGYAAWIIYNSPIVKVTALWALGALAVYWFATSGGMYNIIRGMPLYYRGQDGKLVWWMEVRRWEARPQQQHGSSGE